MICEKRFSISPIRQCRDCLKSVTTMQFQHDEAKHEKWELCQNIR